MDASVFTLNQEDLSELPGLQPEDWDDIVPFFDAYVCAAYCHPIKVTVGGKIVGIGAVIRHGDVAWLGHVIVREAERGKGYGGLVVKGLIEVAHQCGSSVIYLIASQLGKPVYEKAGFVSEGPYLGYQYSGKAAGLQLRAEDASMARYIVPYESAYEAQLSSLDLKVSGEDRMFQLQPFLNNAFVFRRDARTEGFYLPDFEQGVILAENDEAGIALLKLHLRDHCAVSFPAQNEAAVLFMEKIGAVQTATPTRMRLGAARPVFLNCIFNWISPSLG
ncbi:MAG: GNAT family N-acetyltransferase [Clostridiales Family XIII bacterium]|jgi:GNAT superfamily N-acetyltransferase|nr:GNAT family N-acetyltransferase [Clostridiales Family XIII bacterium]